jgi:hypothetical protein
MCRVCLCDGIGMGDGMSKEDMYLALGALCLIALTIVMAGLLTYLAEWSEDEENKEDDDGR